MTVNELLKKANEIRVAQCVDKGVEIKPIDDLEGLLMFAKEGIMHRAHHHKYNQKRNKAAAAVGVDRSMMRLSIDGNVKMIAGEQDRKVVEIGINKVA